MQYLHGWAVKVAIEQRLCHSHNFYLETISSQMRFRTFPLWRSPRGTSQFDWPAQAAGLFLRLARTKSPTIRFVRFATSAPAHFT
jgi:hypothetical protein